MLLTVPKVGLQTDLIYEHITSTPRHLRLEQVCAQVSGCYA